MMEARPVHGILHVHTEIDDVQQHLQHAVDNSRSAGCAQHQKELTIPQHDGRSHRRNGPLAGLNRVRFTLDQVEQILDAGLGGEIVHLVVQQKPQAGHGDAAAISVV
jgi:hypothetical protein